MKAIFTYSLLATTLLGCQRVDLEDYPPIKEGVAIIDIAVNQGSPDQRWNEATRSYELSSTEERQIISLDFFIFNSAGHLVSREKIINPTNTTNRITTNAGAAMSIYVVANGNLQLNANPNPADIYGGVVTLTDLKNIKITNMLSDVTANRTLPMCGFIENQTINPGNGNAVSIPLNFVAAKITVNIRSSLPAGNSLSLIDWKLGSLARYSYIFPRAADAVTPGVANDYVTQSSTNTWTDATMDVGGVPTPIKTTTFYLFENRRGTTVNADPTLKSGATAPANATQILATGLYSSAAGVAGVQINLMLGANSTNDYNIERTKQYTYNVNVIGLNNFTVDTRYTTTGIGFQAEVMSPTLDAHYDFRPLRITAYPGTSVVTILDGAGLATNSSFWLKISQKNITKFINNGSGTYIRPTYSPSTEMLQTQTALHTTTGVMQSQMLYLYCDEFLTDNGSRSAIVRIVHTPLTGTALPAIDIPITQRGILMAGNIGFRELTLAGLLLASQYRLGIEQIDEATLSITPANLVNERTLTMQYGFSGINILPINSFTIRNGYANTQNLVLSNNTLRDPYGRTGTSTISHQFYDPIYNTYSARYCFEKNRDSNGDGQIIGSEIKWYLPSTEEQLLIHAANDGWGGNPTDKWADLDYNSSTQINASSNFAIWYTQGQSGGVANTLALSTRCVRQL